MGSLSRRKGAQYEREVANALAATSGKRAERCLTETRDGNVGDISTDLPLVIQCKVGKRPPVWQAMQQADEAAQGTGRHAVAWCKVNGAGSKAPEEMVCMRPETFLELVGLLVHVGEVW